MIGFALSKLNMLILVTALFSIIVFFTFSMDNITVGGQANRIARQTRQILESVLESDQICTKRDFAIPPHIKSLYTGNLFYVMNVRRNVLEEKQQLVIEITKRPVREGIKESVVASGKVETKGTIHIYHWDDVTNSLVKADKTTLDPQAREELMNDILVMIKETHKGEDNLYLIPCPSRVKALCDSREVDVGEMVKAERGKASNCIMSES